MPPPVALSALWASSVRPPAFLGARPAPEAGRLIVDPGGQASPTLAVRGSAPQPGAPPLGRGPVGGKPRRCVHGWLPPPDPDPLGAGAGSGAAGRLSLAPPWRPGGRPGWLPLSCARGAFRLARMIGCQGA
jgi:hypothetical protein